MSKLRDSIKAVRLPSDRVRCTEAECGRMAMWAVLDDDRRWDGSAACGQHVDHVSADVDTRSAAR